MSKPYEIIQQMTYAQLLARMVSVADVKLHEELSDIDPFWIRWGFMMEELNKKWVE